MSALSAAAAVELLLRARCTLGEVLQVQAYRVRVVQGPNLLDSIAEWGLIPGVVSIFSVYSGALLARSLPGAPLNRDPAADVLTQRAFRHGPEVWGLKADEQADALQVAGVRLAMSVVPRSMVLSVRDTPRDLWPHQATWAWPGVLSVADRFTGRLLARSLPGRPLELAPQDA